MTRLKQLEGGGRDYLSQPGQTSIYKHQVFEALSMQMSSGVGVAMEKHLVQGSEKVDIQGGLRIAPIIPQYMRNQTS